MSNNTKNVKNVMSKDEINERIERLLSSRNVLMDCLGSEFKCEDIVKLRNIFVTKDFLNEYSQNDEGRLFAWGNKYHVCSAEFHYMKLYAEEYTYTQYNMGHSLYVEHINGFIVINTNNLKHNPNIEIRCQPEDIGHLIGKGGAHINILKEYVNKKLEFFGYDLRVRSIRAKKITN